MSPSLTLYEIEDTLQAWANSLELAETDEQREEIRQRVSEYLQAAVDKRDRFVQFLRHLDSQIELAKLEEERIASRRRKLERMAGSLQEYARRTMEDLGIDKLEGNTSLLKLRRNPASVEVLQEAMVPVEYKSCTVTVPGSQADDVLSQFDCKSVKWTVSKTAVAAAIKAGETVPGADLVLGRTRLEVC